MLHMSVETTISLSLRKGGINNLSLGRSQQNKCAIQMFTKFIH